MADEPLFLSSAIDGMLACLQGEDPTGERSYPPVADKDTVKMPDAESVHAWFKRCVGTFDKKGWPLDKWEADSDLAVIALVEWFAPGRRLKACSIQVLKTQGTLREYLGDEKADAYYFRFDWDYGTLGPLFTHPLPHLHAWKADDAPRFVCEGDGDNVVVDFLEWLFRHFYHGDWSLWAEDVCSADYQRKYGDDVPLEYIFRAFQESKVNVLREYPDRIAEIKRLLREKKDKAYPHRASQEDRDLLRYP